MCNTAGGKTIMCFSFQNKYNVITEHMPVVLKHCVKSSFKLAEKMCTFKSLGELQVVTHSSGYPVYALPSLNL